jgi:hypothetical protein
MYNVQIQVNILRVKLVPLAAEEITEYQGGFRSERSNVYQIFVASQIFENVKNGT